MPEVVTLAESGQVGMSGVVLDDAAAAALAAAPQALRPFAIDETACSSRRIFFGYMADRTIGRGQDSRTSLRLSTDRQWDITTVDINNNLYRKVLRGSDGKRPAETDLERITWLLTQVNTITDYGEVASSGAVDMDPADYRGLYPIDVLRDCAAQSGNNFFLYVDDSNPNTPGLFYNDPTAATFSSTLQISNVLSDVDNSTTFAPSYDATLERDPADVYSGVYLKYANGAVFVSSQTTFDTYGFREIGLEAPHVKTETKATARANRYLTAYGSELKTLKFGVQLPKEKVNLIRAGHRIQVKFTHIPEYTSLTYVRIVSLTVRQSPDTPDWYDLDLECRNPKVVDSSPIAAPPVTDNLPPSSTTRPDESLTLNMSNAHPGPATSGGPFTLPAGSYVYVLECYLDAEDSGGFNNDTQLLIGTPEHDFNAKFAILWSDGAGTNGKVLPDVTGPWTSPFLGGPATVTSSGQGNVWGPDNDKPADAPTAYAVGGAFRQDSGTPSTFYGYYHNSTGFDQTLYVFFTLHESTNDYSGYARLLITADAPATVWANGSDAYDLGQTDTTTGAIDPGQPVDSEQPTETPNGSTTLFTQGHAYAPGSLRVRVAGIDITNDITETDPTAGTWTSQWPIPARYAGLVVADYLGSGIS